MFVWLTMAPSRPFKEDRLALLLSTPLSSRPSMEWCPTCPKVVSQAPQHFRSSEKQKPFVIAALPATVYLLGHFPSLRHVNGSTCIGVFLNVDAEHWRTSVLASRFFLCLNKMNDLLATRLLKYTTSSRLILLLSRRWQCQIASIHSDSWQTCRCAVWPNRKNKLTNKTKQNKNNNNNKNRIYRQDWSYGNIKCTEWSGLTLFLVHIPERRHFQFSSY